MIYTDFSVHNVHDESNAIQLDQHLASLGYEIIFANVFVNTKQISQIPKILSDFVNSVSKRTNRVPVISLESRGGSRGGHIAFDILFTKEHERKLQVLSRVTLTLQTSDKLDEMDGSIFRNLRSTVDCFAIRPFNDRQFIELIKNQPKYGYDLLSIDLTTGHFFQQLGIVSHLLKSTSVFIEIELCPILRNPSGSELGNAINQCRMALSNYRSMVVSSGAKSPFETRSTADLTNWGEGILGLKNISKNISGLVERILKKKFSRSSRTGESMDLTE
jgi:RNase P/RNase MRP subunit p30